MPERNVELLQRTMQHILDHPGQHNQTIWVNECGTAACFAGWAEILSGNTIDLFLGTDFVDGVNIVTHAAQLLGISECEADTLFDPGNTPEMLQLMVKDLVNGNELCSYDEYIQEAEQ